jgi:hypothetical protein
VGAERERDGRSAGYWRGEFCEKERAGARYQGDRGSCKTQSVEEICAGTRYEGDWGSCETGDRGSCRLKNN